MPSSHTADVQRPPGRSGRFHIAAAALISGFVAIVINMTALGLCDLAGVATAHGGLLKLFRLVAGLPDIGPVGQAAFHFMAGMGMALFYAYILEPLLTASGFVKGLFFAALVWIVNAAFVLPVTGEGFAGSGHITSLGIGLFALAHTLFFVVLGVIYPRILNPR